MEIFRGPATDLTNSIVGGAGNDTLNGGAGNDHFFAAASDGNDIYNGNGDQDTYDLSGTSAAATVNLDAGTASSAQTGTDQLVNFENVVGGQAGDRITANNVLNVLAGGEGSDTFVFLSNNGAGSGNNRDQITDFSAGDIVDVSAIDANGNQMAILPFAFVGELSNVVGGVGQLDAARSAITTNHRQW